MSAVETSTNVESGTTVPDVETRRTAHYVPTRDADAATQMGAPVQYVCGKWSARPIGVLAPGARLKVRGMKPRDCPECVRIADLIHQRS